MSFTVKKQLTIKSYLGIPKKISIGRVFDISPSINGRSQWNLDSDGILSSSFTGSWTFTPISTFTSSVMMWGAGGATIYGSTFGGAGGYSNGSVLFEAGVPYQIVVGYNQTVWAGGLTGIFSCSIDQSSSIMIAGGGGVAAGQYQYSGHGGNGGGLIAGGGIWITGNNPGQCGGGGSQVAGGGASIYNSATAGGKLVGGLGSTQQRPQGAGAPGYWGGGGENAGGSGGGSGYIHPTKVYNGNTQTSTVSGIPPNSGSIYNNGAGYGAVGSTSRTNGKFLMM